MHVLVLSCDRLQTRYMAGVHSSFVESEAIDRLLKKSSSCRTLNQGFLTSQKTAIEIRN